MQICQASDTWTNRIKLLIQVGVCLVLPCCIPQLSWMTHMRVIWWATVEYLPWKRWL